MLKAASQREVGECDQQLHCQFLPFFSAPSTGLNIAYADGQLFVIGSISGFVYYNGEETSLADLGKNGFMNDAATDVDDLIPGGLACVEGIAMGGSSP